MHARFLEAWPPLFETQDTGFHSCFPHDQTMLIGLANLADARSSILASVTIATT